MLSDLEEEQNLDSESSNMAHLLMKNDDTRTHHTFTDSTVLHPEETSMTSTLLTSTYYQAQMSSGFGEMSRTSSRMSSRPSSRMSSFSESFTSDISDQPRRLGTLTYSSNIGLARVLNERHIHGYLSSSTMSLNNTNPPSEFGCSLTPSIISTPAGERSFSPTGTPLNSPMHTPPGTPPNEKADSGGIVGGFFSSLKAALYGEQQKEVQQIRQKSLRRKKKPKRFGILEKVEEVGVENILGASPAPPVWSRDSSEELSDFDSRFLPNLTTEDKDELEDIQPGSLTMSGAPGIHSKSPDPTIGQLTAPSFSMYGRPSMSPGDFGQIPSGTFDPSGSTLMAGSLGTGALVGGRGPGRVITSPGEKRPQLMGALGVPGTPGTGALRLRPDLGSVPVTKGQDPDSSGFIGNITSMFFGRKGGLL